ncbi:MAG: tetratricopeptide repeat protein [Anaerolineae bacterium]|nr:tetratricopeptide repeat protein [Anaerolineae bacterium]MDW8069276.1 tetratricopeptide repeat protein [Anaerolineae bacterium]
MPYQISWDIPASLLYTGRDQDAPAVQLVIRGLEFLRKGRLEEAAQVAQEALEVARRGHHSIGEGMAALCLSNIYWGTAAFGPALRLALQAYEVFRRQPAPDQRQNEAVAAFNLGLVHHLMGNHAEALNGYYAARQALATALQHWVTHKLHQRAYQCIQLRGWIQQLMQALIGPAPQKKELTILMPVGFVDSGTATLTGVEMGGYLLGVSFCIDGKTLRLIPLQEPLTFSSDCCVFPIPDPAQQPIREVVGEEANYVLAQPDSPMPTDPFYISDGPDYIEFVMRGGKVAGKIHKARVLGGTGPAQYRPIGLIR